MRRLLACLPLTAIILAAACGGGHGIRATASPTTKATPTSISATPGSDDRAGAEAAEQAQFADISRGDRGAEWELLHPAHQALISKDRWIQCNGGRDLQLQVKVLDAQFVRANLPALGEADAWQFKIDITGNIKETLETVYRVYANGKWRFVLDQPGIDHISEGACP